jgi:lipoprotein-anchoring transpeptidase ErfK/SrfK
MPQETIRIGHMEAWQDLFANARQALRKGRKAEARRLALRVVKLAPQQEAPWLLLAATSSPQASIGYLKKALEINPHSKRAKQGLRWAAKRGNVAELSSLSLQEQNQTNPLPKLRRWLLPSAVIATVAFALFAYFRPPGVDQGLRAVSVAAAKQVNGLFSTATLTPSPTSTNTTIPSQTSSPTPSPTSSPTDTPVPTATETALPSKTAVTTNGPHSAEAQAKFRVQMPASVADDDRWIDINLSTQLLTAYEGNEVVRSFVISSGRAGTPTVVGEFPIWIKVRIQDMSGPGYYLTDVPYVMYFYEDYGIHGTYWHDNFGTPMSAGCVNMTIDDSYWMFEFASVGTIVNVHY